MFSGGSNPPLPANDAHCRRNELNSPVYITIFESVSYKPNASFILST